MKKIPMTTKITRETTATVLVSPAMNSPAQNTMTGNITVPLGEEFTVTLCSNASTGYQWNEEVPFSVNGTVIQTGHEYIEPGSQGNGQGQGQVGTAGLEQWTFETQATGETVLYFEYSQPWEGGDKATWTLELTVIVQ
jgi:predicted secreted protein